MKKLALLFWLLPWLALAQVGGGSGPLGGCAGPINGCAGPLGQVTQTYVLDQLAAYPAAAYSVRQMTAGPYLPAYDMTVRRASDNATANIGFSGGVENVAQLAAFCAGTNAYLVTWKNQGNLGSAGDASQSTAASQPQVCASAVVETWNGQPTVYFGGSQYLVTAGNVQGVNATTGSLSASSVSNPSSSVSDLIAQDNVSVRVFRLESGTPASPLAQMYNSVNGATNVGSSISGANLYGMQFDTANLRVYANGALGGTATFSGTARTNAAFLSLGANYNGTGALVTGTMSETWAGGLVQSTTDKATYDLNAAAFYNIAGVTQ